MNVVGRVGSLITQGVYSVATPFHPFGGAVDVIVVEQEDGTYRSTPWYVRFGKFQGVLKGAEKIVRISVNGIEANFHMLLDNSGEAYFVRDALSGSTQMEFSNDSPDAGDPSKSTINDSHDKKDDIFNENNDENQKVITNEQIYGFQDEHSSSEVSVDSSSFTPYHYGSLDEVEDIVESSQNSNPEMVLISVDGHLLTAPISSTEGNTENVQLSTPQFHLGPGDSSDDFGSNGNGWAAGIMNREQSYRDREDAVTRNLCQTRCCAEKVATSLMRSNTFQSCIDSTEQLADRDDSDSLNLDSPNIELDAEYGSRISSNGCNQCIPEVREEELITDNCSDDACTPLRDTVLTTTQISVNSSIAVEEDKDNIVGDSFISQIGEQDLCDHSDGAIIHPLGSESGKSESSVKEHKEDIVVHNNKENGDHDQVPAISEDYTRHDDSSFFSESCSQLSNESPSVQVERESNKTLCETEKIDDENSPSLPAHIPKSNVEQESEKEESNSSKSAGEEGMDTSQFQNHEKSPGLGFEVSLCGNMLRAGMDSNSADEAFKEHIISKKYFEESGPAILKNKNLIVRFNGKYFRWDKAAPIVLGMAAFGTDISIDLKDAIPVKQDVPKLGEDTQAISPSTRGWKLWPIPFRKSKTFQHANSGSSNIDDLVDSVQAEPSIQGNNTDSESPQKRYIRTNVPTTEQISSLNLKDGQNMITFSFCTSFLGEQQVDAHVYLWKWNTRIVISDVDGTITKSDVLGQFMPLVGKDWNQSGVARLFCAIKENGYQLLFLSARAIVQACVTRSFLLNLKQDGTTLPRGPVVISPDGILPSLYREVIRRAPHEFKIACLEDIKALFPVDYNPFYAGFGNRDTDELSYRKIGIPKGKIFIINPKGEVAINHRIDVKSYTSLHTLVNDMFPPTSLAEQEDYNSWNFWKMPLPTIDD